MPLAAATPRMSKLRLLPLIAATYFMVSGGPYGLEDIIGKAGYFWALILLLAVPLIWSLPTSLMIGELASSIPCEGGFYAWVRRALGPFWGFQEGWLSLAASVFDMAIYPRIFVDYLSRIQPTWTAGHRGVLWALAIVLLCTAWNLRGAYSVGSGSEWMFVLLLTPFAIMIALALWQGIHAHSAGLLTQRAPATDLTGALLFALWNYMGWDNASTVAQEVDNPQRNYPRAMLAAAGLVAVSYVLPLAAVAVARIPAEQFTSGAWTDAASVIGGHWLSLAVVLGGTLTGVGMFNALTMSYTRLPFAMAQDGLLPPVLNRLLIRRTKNGVPWVSVLLCASAWAMALGLSFERLITIDLVLYGLSLILEFIALVVLRLKEPQMPRPFRVPGGLLMAIAVGVGPTALIAFAIYASRDEHIGGISALLFSGIIAALGPLLYLMSSRAKSS